MNHDTPSYADYPVVDYTQTMPNRFNPFDNDTENPNARDDYRRVVPQISMSGCTLPEKPSSFERRNVKRVYSRTALTLLFHTVLSSVLYVGVDVVVALVAVAVLGSGADAVYGSSSLAISEVAISYTVANVCAFLVGCRVLGIPVERVFRRPNVTTLEVSKNVSVGWCLQGACMVVVSLLYAAFASVGINLVPSSALDSGSYSSVTYTVATLLYTCVVAPITEEMLFRGVVLRGFSVVSQRFGIFMSALLFGLLHANILQSISTFVLGLYLAFLATKYDSILPTIVVHFFINLAPTLMEVCFSSSETLYDIAMYGFYAVTIALGVVCLCIDYRKRSNRVPVQNALQKKRTLPVAMSSVPVVVLLLVYVASLVSTHATSMFDF